MIFQAFLRNSQTNESRIYEFEQADESGIIFQWTDGNYGCDCNRSLFLYDWNEDKEFDCNDGEPIIKVDKIINKETSEVIVENI